MAGRRTRRIIPVLLLALPVLLPAACAASPKVPDLPPQTTPAWWYYIHMPGIATRPGLDSAMVRLRALPQVRQVSVYDTSPVSPDDP